MNKVFIDLGSHKGQTVKTFYERKFVNDPKNYLVYCFEPQDFKKEWKEITEKHPKVSFINAAAWIYDGEIGLSINEQTVSSTLYSNQMKYNRDTLRTVDCIDFSKWIKKFNNDYVIVKMNIEGAEFDLLNKMIKDGTVKVINKLYIEWHENKTKVPMSDIRCLIENKLRLLNINYKSWRREEDVSKKN